MVGLGSAAERYGSDLHQRCHAVGERIDDLAKGLTGNRNLFVTGVIAKLPEAPELDAAATAIFNAIYEAPGFEPIQRLDDLEAEGVPYAVRDWRTIRQAVEKIPPDVLDILANRKRQITSAAR